MARVRKAQPRVKDIRALAAQDGFSDETTTWLVQAIRVLDGGYRPTIGVVCCQNIDCACDLPSLDEVFDALGLFLEVAKR